MQGQAGRGNGVDGGFGGKELKVAEIRETRMRRELIAGSAFVADNATVRGEVHVADRASIWFGAVVRGDTERIEIGERTNVQDLAVLHADPGFPCWLGEGTTVGHAAVVHGATIERDCLIGIRAVVLNGARIGAGSIVGAGALVTEGTEIPPGSLAVGIPARVVRKLNDDDRARISHAAEHYVAAANRYRETEP
jgi:carbonic anhydrase/acetyltransferase-like protein (isoleucine patch superfamily)